jgi:hypothetical protein
VELPELAEAVLEESYVLGITAQPGAMTFDVEFALTKDHPSYAPPPRSETECFRRGTLRFVSVEHLVWEGQGAAPAVDASGEVDFGHIDSLEWDERWYVVTGDWGRSKLPPVVWRSIFPLRRDG